MDRPLLPRVTFGMIVLNGEPFTRYNLRALYPFAHEIIVVEGACPSARSAATEDGHSQDGTLEVLRRFKAEEDPQGRLLIVTAEDEGHENGFWSEKDEMSRAYARRAAGNYLWQIDVDEFYRPQDMQAVLEMLQQDPEIKAVSFRMLTFWGGLCYTVDGFYLQTVMRDVHRVVAWGLGYRYLAHRPPTVTDEKGRDLREVKALTAKQMVRKGIYLYHYELLFPKQVLEKCAYYAEAAWLDSLRDVETWARECYLQLKDPFHVHMVYQHPSWLERYRGEHPPQVVAMVDAVRAGQHPGISMRPTDDIDALLSRSSYRLRHALMKCRLALVRAQREIVEEPLRKILQPTPVWPVLKRARAKLRGKARKEASAQALPTGYSAISKEEITTELTHAWQDPAIADAQRRLVDEELVRMYNGDVIRPYRVLADALLATGCETGQIIEVGCASGYYYEVLRHLSGHEIRYMGIDYSLAMIDEARRHYPDTSFRAGDATALPLADEVCDVLISGTVLLHVPDYEKAIAESARVTREWVIFHKTPVVPGPTRYHTKFAYGVKCVEIHFGEQELLDLFRQYGLDVVTEFAISQGLKTYVCRKQRCLQFTEQLASSR